MDVDQQEDDAKAAPPPAAGAAVAAVTSGDDDEDDGEIDEEQLEEYQEMLASIGAHPVSFVTYVFFCFTGFCLRVLHLVNLSKLVMCLCAPSIIMRACLSVNLRTSLPHVSPPYSGQTENQ